MKPLLEHLPQFYQGSDEVAAFQGSLDPEVIDIYALRDDFVAQLVVDTSTWGLSRWWEPMLGIKADPSQSLDYRRSMVKAKLRGHGTATKELIRSTVASFFDGEIEVIVYPSEFRFEVLLSGRDLADFMRDIPALRMILDEIKPAHLVYELQGIIDAAVFRNPNAFRLPHLELELAIPNFADCVTLDGRYLLNGSWPLNQTRRGTLSLDALAVETSAVNREALKGTLVRDNLFCLDGSWTLDGSKNLDAYYCEEEI